MAKEILVFRGNKGIYKHRGKVAVRGDHAPLQREGANDIAVNVVEFGAGDRAIVFQLVNLREVGGIDENQAGKRANERGKEYEQCENESPDDYLANRSSRLLFF